MKYRILLYSVLLTLFLPVLSFGNTSIRITAIDTSQLPGISIYFSQSDEQNTTVGTVSEEDVQVYFNDGLTNFDLEKEIARIPMATAIVIDASYSIRRQKRQEMIRNARSFIKGMAKEDAAAIFIFNDTLIKMTDFTGDLKKLNTALDRIRPGGVYTRLYDSILNIVRYIDERTIHGRKSILLYGDGYDENSSASLKLAIERAKASHIPVYAAGYTNIAQKKLDSLKQIARETGGLFSYQSSIDLGAAINPEWGSHVYRLSFSVIHPQRENIILIKNARYNSSLRLVLLLSDAEREAIEHSQWERTRNWIVIILLVVIAAAGLVVFMLLRRRDAKYGPGDSREYAGKFDKYLPWKAPLGKDASFAGDEFDRQRIGQSAKLDILCEEFKRDIDNAKARGLLEVAVEGRDDGLDPLTEIAVLKNKGGASGFDVDRMMRDIHELDPEGISKLIPFMIHMVNDSEGYDKEVNASILKELAHNLNLDLDASRDMNNLDEWWKKHSGQAALNVAASSQGVGELLKNGLAVNAEISVVAEDGGSLVEFPARVAGGDALSLELITRKSLPLDSLICYDMMDIPQSEKRVAYHGYVLLRLDEIRKESDRGYYTHYKFLRPEEADHADTNRLIQLLRGPGA